MKSLFTRNRGRRSFMTGSRSRPGRLLNRSVLVVEDEILIAMDLAFLLEQHGPPRHATTR